jgi:hypothetical protein
VNRRAGEEGIAFGAVGDDGVPPVLGVWSGPRRDRNRHERPEHENHDAVGPPALGDQQERDRCEPCVEGRLLDHDGAAREQTGDGQPHQMAAAKVRREGEQREHCWERRQELAGQRERLDERGRGKRCK